MWMDTSMGFQISGKVYKLWPSIKKAHARLLTPFPTRGQVKRAICMGISPSTTLNADPHSFCNLEPRDPCVLFTHYVLLFDIVYVSVKFRYFERMNFSRDTIKHVYSVLLLGA